MTKQSGFHSRALTALVLASLLTVSVGGGASVFAARPSGGGTTASGALSVTPDPATAYGGTYTVAGSGFKVGVMVNITLKEPGCCRFFSVMPDSSGRISFWTTTMGPGTYTVEAYQRLNSRKLTLMASRTYEVR